MTNQIRLSARRLGVALVVACVGLTYPGGAAVAADADDYTFEGAGFAFGSMARGDNDPPVTLTQLKIYSDVLQLDADQELLARDLWELMVDDHRRLWTKTREQLADLRAEQASTSGGGDGAFMVMLTSQSTDESKAIDAAFERGKEALEAEFFEELRLVLTPDQESRQGALEQARRRQTTLATWATFDEERADLVELVRGLSIEQMSSELTATLEEYASVLDGVLVNRNRLCEQLGELADEHAAGRAEMLGGFSQLEGGEDQQAMMQRMMSARAKMEEVGAEGVRVALSTRSAAARVRDINVQYAQEIEEALGGEGTDLADRFRVAFGRLSDPQREEGPRGMFGSRAELALNEVLAIGARTRIRAIQQQAEEAGVAIAEGGIVSLFGSRTEAEALSEDQEERVRALQSRYETRRAAIQRLWADELRSDEDAVLRIGSSSGQVRLNRKSEDGESGGTEFRFVVSTGSGGTASFGEDQGPPEGYLKDIASLEQSVIDELRSILTIDQRSVIANF